MSKDDHGAATPSAPAASGKAGAQPSSKAGTTDAAAGASGLNKRIAIGAATGIGSAAILAALLYANRKKSDR